jgi:hypothetical protein
VGGEDLGVTRAQPNRALHIALVMVWITGLALVSVVVFAGEPSTFTWVWGAVTIWRLAVWWRTLRWKERGA